MDGSLDTRQSVTLKIRCVTGRHYLLPAPLEVDPHTLVVAAWGRFLPPGVLPARIERDGVPLAFYDPLQHLRHAGVRSGDVLVCEREASQDLGAPSMLGAYRAMRQYARSCVARACEFGHLTA